MPTTVSIDNGYAYVEVTGGFPPYTYQWYENDVPIPGATQPNIDGSGYGSCSVDCRDASGCTIRGYRTYVDDWMELSASFEITPASSENTPNGAIDMLVHSGMPPYTYTWSNGATTKDIRNLLPGHYSVEIRDMMGCVTNVTATVDVSSPTKNMFSPGGVEGDLSIQSIVPNPVNDLAEVQYTLRAVTDVKVEIYDELGQLVYSYNQGQKPVGLHSAWLPTSELPAGRYSCRLVSRGGIAAVPFLVVR